MLTDIYKIQKVKKLEFKEKKYEINTKINKANRISTHGYDI